MEAFSTPQGLQSCPVCGQTKFERVTVLWPALIKEWELNPTETDYIDLQQGLLCAGCKNNLRGMTLASAVMRAFDFTGTFHDFCEKSRKARELRWLEINPAANLTPFLELLPHHSLHSFPQLDIQRMEFPEASWEVIIHSDTLEHVPDSSLALEETYRVLKPGGYLFYTVPIVIGRMTRQRGDLSPTYHGNPKRTEEDWRVQTEYGSDFWCELFAAGFRRVELTSLIFPASIAIAASK